ncbi:MAG: hypothetical protein ABIC04_01835 [Nanoarchaeota archaeon]
MKFESDVVIGIMKKTIFSLLAIILYISAVSAFEPYHCDNLKGLEGLCFDVTFAVTTDKEMNIPAKYNFPHFIRAGDHLYIKNINISNLDVDKSSDEGVFSLMIRPVDYIDKPYTDLKKIYPENYGDFSFKSLRPSYYCEYIFNENGYYKTTCNDEEVRFNRYNIELFKEGEWIIVDDFTPKNKNGSWIYTSIFNGIWEGNTFRVTSGFEMDNMKDLKSSLMFVVFSLIVILIFGIIQSYLAWLALKKKDQKENRVLFWIYLIFIVVVIIIILYFVKKNII